MTCPVTSKNYSICCDNGKDKENTKFMFQKQLQSLFPLTPVIIAPEFITTDAAHSIRLVEIIPKKYLSAGIFNLCVKTICIH